MVESGVLAKLKLAPKVNNRAIVMANFLLPLRRVWRRLVVVFIKLSFKMLILVIVDITKIMNKTGTIQYIVH